MIRRSHNSDECQTISLLGAVDFFVQLIVFLDWARAFRVPFPTQSLVTVAVGAVLRLGLWSVLVQSRIFCTV